jgi:hypothetical protein
MVKDMICLGRNWAPLISSVDMICYENRNEGEDSVKACRVTEEEDILSNCVARNRRRLRLGSFLSHDMLINFYFHR